MMWSRIYEILKAVAALSGLVAFAGFAYTYHRDVGLREATVASNWQAVAIFRVVTESGEAGIELQQIVGAVQTEMIQGRAFLDIDPEIAARDQVLRGIVELAAKNSIIRSTDGRYRVPLLSAGLVSQDIRAAEQLRRQEAVVLQVLNNPGKFSSRELRDYLSREYGISEAEALRTINPLLAPGPWGPPVLIPMEPRPKNVLPRDLKLIVWE